MDPFTLSSISKDPNSGIRIAVKRITVMLPAAGGGGSVKEKFTETLNAQKHKYLPDIGGFLLGYTDVKYRENVFEWSKKDVPQSVRVKAKFYLFSVHVGALLRCTVTDRTKEKISCEAINHFPVEVHHPAQIWDTVTKGDLVLVEVDLVSQPAHQTPVIIGRIKMNESRVENIDFDEDTEGEEESSEMEVGETLSGDSKIDEDEQKTISTEKSKGSKKRKADDVSTSQDLAPRSPVKKRTKKDDTSEQSPVSTTPSTSTAVAQSQPEVPESQPSSSSVLSSPKSAVKVSPKKKSQLQLNSPKKSNPQGPDTDSGSSTEEEASPKVSLKKADNVQKKMESDSSSSSSISEEESEDKAKPSSEQKKKEDNKDKQENKSDDKSKKSLCVTSTDKEIPEKDNEVKVPENSNTVPERPPTPHKSELPEGFTVLQHASKKGVKRIQLKIEGPNQKKFYSYKAVHEFVEANPNYLEDSSSKNSSSKMSTENVKGQEGKQSKDIRKPKWMSAESSSGLKAGVETLDKNDAPFKNTNDSSTRPETSSDGDKNLRKESESKVTPAKSSSSSDTDSSEDEKIDDAGDKKKDASKETNRKTSKDLLKNKKVVKLDYGGDEKKDASKGTIRQTSKDLQKNKKVESSSSSSESESEDEEPMKVQKPSAGATVKDSATVKESATAKDKDGESSFEDSDSDSDTGFDEDDQKEVADGKKPENSKRGENKSDDESSSSDDSDSDDEADKKKIECKKGKVDKNETKPSEDLKAKNHMLKTPSKKLTQSESNQSPKITHFLSKATKGKGKDEEKRVEKENLIDKVVSQKSPGLSSTVVTDSKSKDKVKVPDGISPILKKTKSKVNTSIYDMVMKNSSSKKTDKMEVEASTSKTDEKVAVEDKDESKKRKKKKEKKDKDAKKNAGFL